MQRSALVAAARRATPGMLTKSIPADRQYVCFCGCKDNKHFGNTGIFGQTQMRMFQEHLNLDSARNLLPEVVNPKHQVALWQTTHSSNALALSSSDEIEQYVLNMCKSYFRTTKKASMNLDSTLVDHGLDSLDVIELVIQVEDELNYLIDAEKLELFAKPRHFVNFITQMEAYKTEHSRLPHEGIHANLSMKHQFNTNF